jgi:hypothetical protein
MRRALGKGWRATPAMVSLSESVDIVWLCDDFRLDDQPAIHGAARARALAAFAKMWGR